LNAVLLLTGMKILQILMHYFFVTPTQHFLWHTFLERGRLLHEQIRPERIKVL
jgi:hypothetical protein